MVELLRRRAESQAGQRAFTFLADGGEEETLTYGELAERAYRIARLLRQRCRGGERAVLLLPPGLDYIAAFFGCLCAGVVAVPLYPPRNERGMPRLWAVVRDARPALILTTTAAVDRSKALLGKAPGLLRGAVRLAGAARLVRLAARLRGMTILTLDALPEATGARRELPAAVPEDLAFLQYTSGSTATPRGVMVTHANLMHNAEAIQRAGRFDHDTVGVSWLPPYHDMGLIGAILQPLYSGFHSVLMSPVTFLKRPAGWLEAIARYRAAYSGGPNFAYELCCHKVGDAALAELDLSSWAIAFTGAEPVRADTLRRFAQKFAPCGFRYNAFCPVYGLAEATLMATCGTREELPPVRHFAAADLEAHRGTEVDESAAGRPLVGCGRSLPDQELVIADPRTARPCAAGEVGEVWLAGASVAGGYWRRPSESRETFEARLASGEGPFLRTGDLGFLAADGELYLTGRLKDLIILDGRNLYPQDVELTVERCHPHLRPGSGAAFSVEVGGEERLVVVQEIRFRRRPDSREVLSAIRQAVAQEHGVPLHEAVLLEPGTISKTSSGKIQRHACRRRLLDGELAVVARWCATEAAGTEAAGDDVRSGDVPSPGGGEPAAGRGGEEIAAWLSERLARQVGIAAAAVDVRKPFAYYGLSSADAVGLAGELEAWLGRPLAATLAWEYPSVEELAAALAAGSDGEERTVVPPAARGAVRTGRDVAIVGLGCRFPGAATPEELWELLCDGRNTVCELPPGRRRGTAATGQRGGFLERIDELDRELFALTADEARLMDPQQRLLLEVMWETVEHAGYRPEQLAAGRTGVFVGMSTRDYSRLVASAAGEAGAAALPGNLGAMAANRISYAFDCRGPSLTVDTACSSSLVALHLARQALLTGEATAALVGGVNLILDDDNTRLLDQNGLLAAGGCCRAFDEKAEGYVRSEGAAAVLLKPLAAALADGDRVLAVLKGSATSHDGHFKLGLTSPSPRAQRELVAAAHADAGTRPETLGLVEAHAAGNALGDALEVHALSRAIAATTARRGFCALGTVKSNLGHGEAVSGMASLLKTVLALAHGALPPTLHVAEPNRRIAFEETPFYVNERLRPWPGNGVPRRAGVSSSGLGGANVHLVLEQGPAPARPPQDRGVHVFTVSGRTVPALRRSLDACRRRLGVDDETPLGDLCFTANTGRSVWRHRVAVVAASRDQLCDRLSLLSLLPSWDEVGTLRGSSIFYGDAEGQGADELWQDLLPALHQLPAEDRRALGAWCRGRSMERHVRPRLDLGDAAAVAPPPERDDERRRPLLSALARLWTLGVEVDWAALDQGLPRRRARLPGHPFERQRYWLDLPAAPAAAAALPAPPARPPEPPADDELSARERLERWLRAATARKVQRTPEEIGLTANLHELGVDSIAALRLIHDVERSLGVEIGPLELFEHPTIAALAAFLEPRVAAIPPPESGCEAAAPAAAPPVAESHEPFPCVELQTAFLMARGLPAHLGGRGCRIYCETRIDEALDPARLGAALQRLIRRHPILRTVFPGEGRQQVLAEVPELRLGFDDLRGRSAAAAAARCRELREELSRANPPPDRWPLLLVHLCRTGEEESRLLVSSDMLQGDFLSLLILVREWRRLYRDPEADLPALDVTFERYVAHLGQLRRGSRYAADRAWWLARLEGFPPPPALPPARRAGRASRPDFASHAHVFEAPEWERLQDRARAHGVTPSALVLACYGQVLAEWTGETRFALNLPVFNRLPVAAGVESMMGPLATNVLLAAEIEPGLDVWEQARRLHLALLAALEHRSFSGVEVSRALIEHRKSGLEPVAPVVFTSALYGGELWGEIEVALSQTAMVWLDCILFQDRGRLRLFWDYVEELFEPAEIERRFARLVERLARLAAGDDLGPWSPRRAADETARDEEPWPALAAADWELITAVNATDAPTPETTVPALISEQAARAPDAPAVLAVEGTLTYRQLEEAANRVANALAGRGLGPDDRVALLLPRGAAAIVAAVGVQKIGAGYVPVDPRHPEARRRAILESCDPALLLTTEEVRARLPETASFATLELTAAEIRDASPAPPARRAAPDHLAYVLYTSGSTGRPKGAMLTQRNAVNTLVHSVRRFRITPEDRFLSFSSMSHDMSTWEIFGALTAGAAVVTLDDGLSREPRHWLELLERHRVTVWNSVPTGMKLLLDFWEGKGREGACPLRLATLGGDWIPLTLPERIRRFFPGVEVVSVGGPTECCLWQICYPVGDVDPTWRSIPYGKPMTNHRVYLLDEALEPVGVGEVGEMYVAGAGVALGYLHDPERTARSFLVHPRLRRRMYRTGDLGRYLPDGNLEILGRVDHQVKIRGFRVELGDVDAALQAHAAVDAAATVTWDDAAGGPRIAACYVARRPVSAAELRAHLGERLPDYMVPARFLELPELPLNSHHKVDRRELARRLAAPPAAPAHAPRQVSFDDLSAILAGLCQVEMRGKPKYMWGSGGGLYPVQTYVHVPPERLAGVAAGTYYYHPVDHALVRLPRPAEEGGGAPFGEGAFTVFLVGELTAVEPMYGDKSRDLCLLEAGLMSRVLSREARSRGLCLRPAAELDPDAVTAWLGLAATQVPVCCLVAGAAPAEAPAPPAEPLTVVAGPPAEALAAPAAVIEERLLALWRRLFERDDVTADDNFFEMGGNSQLAVMAIRRAGDELGLEIQVADLFSYPSVGKLAAHLGSLRPDVVPAPAPPAPEIAANPYAGLPFPKGVKLVGPDEREAFKHRQTAVRRDLDGAASSPLAPPDAAALSSACSRRRSWRHYDAEPVARERLVGFLADVARLVEDEAVPLTVYFHAQPERVAGIAGGFYRLEPQTHRLVLASSAAERLHARLHFPHNREMFARAAFSLFFVGDLAAARRRRPGGPRDLCLIEVGRLSQRIEEAALAHQLGLCQIGMINSAALADLLELGEDRVFLHSHLGGALGPEQQALIAADARTVRLPATAARPVPPRQPVTVAPAVAVTAGNGAGGRAVAVIGMAGRFPQADDLEQYWQLLRDGTEVVGEVPSERWDAGACFDDDADRPGGISSKWGSFLGGLEYFDPLFFHVSGVEARVMDPQQRLLLMLAWETLEAAGYGGGQLSASRTGVFIGASYSHHRELMAELQQDAYTGLGTQNALLANRVSYFLDLHGPSLTLDTLCSSSLVALHLACRSLRDGECDQALVGGVHAGMTRRYFEALSRLKALSPTGHCYTFDRRADGIVSGEGAGMVLLKPLARALADGDAVAGVIRGTAVNHGGRAAGLTVPNPLAQAALIASALDDAGVEAGSLGYVEAHGTGTSLGDPIEIDGLTRAFGNGSGRRQFCAIGSVKTNLGHLDAAAGIAGLLKVLLAMRAGELPPTLHLREPNPAIAFEASPFYVNDRLRPWPVNGGPRRAAISGFGMGGTNAHAVVEEAPPVPAPARPPETQPAERPQHLLTLSARTEPALRRLAERFAGRLPSLPEAAVGDVCFTANCGRTAFAHRLAVRGASLAELRGRLAGFLAGATDPAVSIGQVGRGEKAKAVMLFTGQGAQRPGMGRELYQTEPTFRQALERCDALLRPHLEQPLLAVLYPESEGDSPIHETAYAQPALFALEYALCELWRSWGIEPAAVMGHSVGELVAACVAGVFALEDGLRLIAERGRLMQSLPRNGRMAVVFADEATVLAELEPYREQASIAALNGPANTVVSGEASAVAALLAALQSRGVKAQPVQVSHAFHSPLMEPILDDFERAAREVTFQAPRLPLASNLHGRLLAPGEVPDAAYWRRHVRGPVRFAAGLEALAAAGNSLFLEVGPGPVLTGMGRRVLTAGAVWAMSLKPKVSEQAVLLDNLGLLFTRGAAIDWQGLDRGRSRRRIALPTYPFEQVRCWPEPAPAERRQASLLGRRLAGGDLPAATAAAFERRLVLAGEPLVEDHRVRGRALLAGAVQLDLLLAAAREQRGGEKPLRVRNLSFHQPLVAEPDRSVRLRVVLEETEPGGESFAGRVLSRPAEDGGVDAAWTEHARGELAALSSAPPPPLDPARLASRLAHELEPGRFYARAAEMGVAYGPRFRALVELRYGDGEALARLRPTADAGAEHVLDPGLLDGALQTALALSLGEGALRGAEPALYLPVSVREVRVHRPVSGPAWVWSRRRHPGSSGPGLLWADAVVCDDGGEVVAELEGLCARRVSGPEAEVEDKGEIDGWFHRLRWREATPAAAREVPAGTWLLWLDPEGVGEALGQRLQAAGRRCLRVLPGPSFEARGDGVFVIDPAREDHYPRLVAAVSAAAPDLAGIVHLGRCTTGETEPAAADDLDARLGAGVRSLFFLVRALAARRGDPLELWLVTAGGRAAAGGRVDPDKAAAWGLLRTVDKEHGSWACHGLDLPRDSAPAAARADRVYDVLRRTAAPFELAWRQGVLLTSGVEPAAADLGAAAPPPVRRDGVYLITGGQGGLGLECARALLAATRGGSPCLVLLNRSPLPPPEEQAAWLDRHPGDDPVAVRLRALRELADAGARVWPVAGDVADAEAMARLVSAVRERYGALHGVVHAAGVVRDEMLRTKSAADFQAVLAPKVRGAWILDRLTRDEPVDFFVLFSSLIGTVGNVGQGDYAAANAYLDALAAERRRRGLAGTSMLWGAWAEVGMAARAGIDVRAVGLEPISPALGRDLFTGALSRPDEDWLLFRRVTARRAAAVPRQRVSAAPVPGGEGPPLERRLRAYLADEVARNLGLERAQIDPRANFMELGLDSLMAVKIKGSLEDQAGISLDPTLLFEYPSVAELADYLAAHHGAELARVVDRARPPEPEPPEPPPPEPPPPSAAAVVPAAPLSTVARAAARCGGSAESDVAVIGLACRFPRAATPEAFWELLRDGVDVITEVPPERWSWRDVYDPAGRRPGTSRSKWGGFLSGVEDFDPLFFGISPRETQLLDPQQRLFLEVAWETLERAGYTPEQLAAGRTGVYVGISTNEYARLLAASGLRPEAHAGSGNVLCMVPNRVSYLFDWSGPSMAVDTACSSSLAALHMACRNLADGEADLAVVGGTNLILSPDPHVVFSHAGMLSPRGRCHTFDDRADGYVRGEGVMAVLLKPLARALADGDEVWAVIRGTALNHDGHSKVGLTAPNPKAQREVVLAALERAAVDPAAVSYVEAHGTGTAMGDPIELRGLTEAFRTATDRCGFCAVGTVKSNLGHLEPAAGLAGFVKVVLALRHGELPPTLHVRSPNQDILFEETPFFINDRRRPWPPGDGPRVAGVSSFGFGGVNVHAVVAEAPARPLERPKEDRPVHALALSARSPRALGELRRAYLAYLDGDGAADVRDVCFTANTGRRHFEHRLAVVFSGGREELRRALLGAAGDSPRAAPETVRRLRESAEGLPREAAAALPRYVSGPLWEEVAATLPGSSPPAADPAPTAAVWESLMPVLAELYVHGADVDWQAVDRGLARRRVPLPTYPFERRRYWPREAPVAAAAEAPVAETAAAAPVRRQPSAPEGMEGYLRERLARALQVEPQSLTAHTRLTDLGLDSVATMDLLAAVKEDFDLTLYPNEVIERPSIRELADYLTAELRQEPAAAPPQAPPAPVFLLSSPRAGSTLLRVMLAGHPGLFCPPELNLLLFRGMAERARQLDGGHLGEGLVRAWMELRRCDAAASRALVGELEARDAPVEEVYGLMQQALAGRLLVDKSPSYATSREALERAEEVFAAPRYVCLVRHPYAVIESFVRTRMHKLLGLDGVDPAAAAEEIWTRSNRHLLELMAGPAGERCRLVRYETLVREPEPVMRELCELLGVGFDEAMLRPYEGRRMTDGVHEKSLAIGDPNFLRHTGIEPSLAESWKRIRLPRPLAPEARQVARELGYALGEEDDERPAPRRAPPAVLVPIRAQGTGVPLFCFHPSGGQVFAYQPLAALLGPEQPLYALQSRALANPACEHGDLHDMAREYAEALRGRQPHGPYRLLGWSMGGHLAVAAAHALEQQGEEVELVAVWDSRYPVLDPETPPDPLRGVALAFGGVIGEALSRLEPADRKALRGELLSLGPEGRIERAVLWARDSGLLAPGLRLEELVRQATLVDHHMRLLEGYRPRPIRAPIHVWWAREDLVRRPRTDWGEHTGGRVRIATVTGNHFTMVREPGLRQLAEGLRQALAGLGESPPAERDATTYATVEVGAGGGP